MSHLTPPSEADSPGVRGPKACVTCARAKVKCIFDAEAIICTRCRRLRKPCAVQEPGSHRRKTKAPSHVARIERKLDGVAAILATSSQVGGSQLRGQGLLFGSVGPSPLDHVKQVLRSEDEEFFILKAYWTHMAQYFPFVVIPPDMTLEELKTKPFLFMTVMTIGCRHHIERQTSLAKRVREVIAEKVLLRGEQSLDILQGLLVYLAWYHIHFPLGSQLGNLVHLIMAQLSDLGLNRSPDPRYHKGLFGTVGYFRPEFPGPKRTLAERRAYLGGFYISTLVSMTTREIEPIRFSAYAEECCQLLEEERKYASDVFLVHLVRIARMSGRITRTLSPDDWSTSSTISAPPIGAYVTALQAELRSIKSSLPPSGTILEDILWLHYFLMEIYLYGVAVHDTNSSANYGDFPMTRLKMLFACLGSTKSFFEKWYSIPISVYFDCSYFPWSLMGHASVVLSKLCLYDGEGWDAAYASDTIDFCTTMDTMMAKMKEANAAAERAMLFPNPGAPSESSSTVPPVFENINPKMQRWKEIHNYRASQTRQQQQRKQQSMSALSAGGAEAPIASTAATTTNDEFLFPGETSLMDFFDDSFWPQFPTCSINTD
ncbi:uncharacterized protein PV06_07543 [Exophiala oligosperma]|uniref:Zn(2)-C6 fungal-type domain-containing protein n=1 Tax=Exophiala oligosperma TaxID=215243 RepID=A0A0D2AJN2_9EURO|nr:uncharacterized protein PV06_07543 [Exophiala oligosperma]KIW40336.1 hypothetical protein PV06_07543 [Exophiala oligosperma]